MKKILILTVLLISTQLIFAQTKADDITGEWLNADKDRKILVQKSTNGTYFAKISWLRNANDAEYKIGQIVIKSLAFENGEYKNGQAYSPSNGGWVKATAKLKNANQLDVTGSKYFISKTRSYTRVK